MTNHGRRIPLAPPLEPTPDEGATATITRRSALQGLAAGLGLAIGAPAEAQQIDHPLAAHVVHRAQKGTRAAATAARALRFFDPHQFATLTVASELIVPGSVASGSPAYIDEVLAIEHDDVRLRVVNALAAVDAAAREAHGTTFRAIPAARQAAILEALTTLPTLKSWIAGAHYSSEAGMKELGFTGSVFFGSFPACEHAGGHE